MDEWYRMVQTIVEDIDRHIRKRDDEALTLSALSQKLGFSEYYISRKFREISGMHFRDYLRHRTLAFALKEVRDTSRGLLEIALDHGFSSHEAFSRSFKEAYGRTPSEYRREPAPVVLRTIIKPFDCYLIRTGETNMASTTDEVKVYFVSIPAHKYLHIRNYESIGYWDFWQKQSAIPGQDCETICGLLDSVKGKLDDMGGGEANSGGRSDHGVHQRAHRQALQLGHPPGGELRRQAPRGLLRRNPKADADHGRSGGRIHRIRTRSLRLSDPEPGR